jgi:tripartite-type tricarboxylate transporter receptor subunit TctC
MKAIAILAAALLSLAPGLAPAQVGGAVTRIEVPFAPGGARELPARAFYQEMAKELGQPVIIENRPGAGGAIGTSYVARSAPDGRTLVMAASSHFVTAAMGATPHYDPIKDFVPVANIGTQSYVLMVSASLPVHNVAEFIDYVRKQPGKLNYGSAGVGSSTHLAMAALVSAAGLDMMHVPYKSTQESANDVAAGRAQAVIVPNAGVGIYLQEPRLRIIGVTSAKPSPFLPGVPPISQAGLPNYVYESWFGLLAPAATPPAIVKQINAAVNRALAYPEVRERLATQGLTPTPMDPAAFAKVFAADQALMSKLVKDAKLAPQ